MVEYNYSFTVFLLNYRNLGDRDERLFSCLENMSEWL